MKNTVGSVFILMFVTLSGLASGFTSWDGEKLILDNGAVQRVILWDEETGSLTTESLRPVNFQNSYTREDSKEFNLLLNDKVLTGRNRWKVISFKPVNLDNGGQGCIISLAGD